MPDLLYHGTESSGSNEDSSADGDWGAASTPDMASTRDILLYRGTLLDDR